MKILFVYPYNIVREVPLNIMYVSAAVKAKGHQTSLFHFTPYKQGWIKSAEEIIEEEFIKKIDSFKPDIIGFSMMIQNYNMAKRLSSIAKNKFKIPVIWGGVQAILDPERCINEQEIDYVCTGEAEHVFTAFIEKLEKGKDVSSVCGIWSKNAKGRIIKTGRPDLIEDLDSLPFPDRDLLELRYYRAELTGANILTARGCPFPCAYCHNKKLMEIFKDKGRFVRQRSIENVFKEVKDVIEKYKAPSFYFSDEMFTLDKKRALEFCKKYKENFNKPFMVQTRIDYMDEELARELAGAGCFMVNMAIESGNENTRRAILNKNISNEDVYKAYEAVHRAGMMSASYNMIGVPGETMATLWDTININKKVKPHRIMCSIYMPLPGTQLGDKCKKDNRVNEAMADTTNYYSQVVMKISDVSPHTLIGYQGFFDWYVLLPKYMYPFVHSLRFIYQMLVSPKPPKNSILKKIRENIIEAVYQMKKFLPQRKFHVKNR